jgi:hypothetical protein
VAVSPLQRTELEPAERLLPRWVSAPLHASTHADQRERWLSDLVGLTNGGVYGAVRIHVSDIE